MIKEKWQLFVTVENNDDTAKMKVNNPGNLSCERFVYDVLLV